MNADNKLVLYPTTFEKGDFKMLKRKSCVIVMVLAMVSSLLTACSGRGKETSVTTTTQEAMSELSLDTSNLVPNTGESVPANADANRRWSGEVFLSDNDYPDLNQPTEIEQGAESACIVFEDDNSPRRHGGCAE